MYKMERNTVRQLTGVVVFRLFIWLSACWLQRHVTKSDDWIGSHPWYCYAIGLAETTCTSIEILTPDGDIKGLTKQ